jgi:TetR/AcrR family transcriptional regulator, copper-responsive repressor
LLIDFNDFILTTMKSSGLNSRARGRPRQFDRSKVLAAAMRQFWQYGYEATSLSALSSAMGLNPPSIYGAFGDKKELFAASIEAYLDGPGCFAQAALAEETSARAAIQRLLLEAARNFTSGHHPPGCMVVLSALNCTDEATDIRDNLVMRRNQSAKAIIDRIKLGKKELPQGLSPEAFGDLVVTIFQGMSIRARDGATREELEAVANQTMKLWPQHN